MWGWGVMNQVAVQEAANIGFPMENFIGNWWSGAEHDVTPAGAAADGYKSLNMNRVGDLPVFAEIQTHVHDAGNAAGDGSNLGSVLYTRGMYAAMLAAEAIAKAQEIHGVADVTPAMVRDGMEALSITNARMEELGMAGVGPEFSVSCQNHGGSGLGIVQQWDASAGSWVALTDYIEANNAVTGPLIAEDSAAFAAENNITPGCL
jgi:branched-chain amino acid transport system substrate-binding protein